MHKTFFMKTPLFLVITILGFGNYIFAQNTPTKYEFGMQVYSNEFDFEQSELKQTFTSGMQVKRVVGKNHMIRFGFQHSQENQSFVFADDNSTAFSSSYSKQRHTDLKLGIERVWHWGNFSPFTYTDLWYRNEEQSGWFIGLGGIAAGRYYYKGLTRTNYLGINSGIGLKYNPLSFLYISIESGFSAHSSILRGPNNRLNSYMNPVNTLTIGVRF